METKQFAARVAFVEVCFEQRISEFRVGVYITLITCMQIVFHMFYCVTNEFSRPQASSAYKHSREWKWVTWNLLNIKSLEKAFDGWCDCLWQVYENVKYSSLMLSTNSCLALKISEVKLISMSRSNFATFRLLNNTHT